MQGAAVADDVPVHIHDADRHMLLDPVGTSGGFGRYLEQAGLDVTPPELIESVDDGQRDQGRGHALHRPAHARAHQGSVCFSLEVEGEAPVLFSGDHLFKGSIGRFDLPGGSFDELMASMAEKILPLDDAHPRAAGPRPGHDHRRRAADNPFLLELQEDLGLR